MIMKREFKVRFNLSRGIHFKHWKLEYDGHVEYYDPAHTQLIMHNCKLHNNRSAAQKIFSGENKTVCAWVRCSGLTILHDEELYAATGKQLNYNPRNKPYWSWEETNVDGKEFKTIYSHGNRLFTA